MWRPRTEAGRTTGGSESPRPGSPSPGVAGSGAAPTSSPPARSREGSAPGGSACCPAGAAPRVGGDPESRCDLGVAGQIGSRQVGDGEIPAHLVGRIEEADRRRADEDPHLVSEPAHHHPRADRDPLGRDRPQASPFALSGVDHKWKLYYQGISVNYSKQYSSTFNYVNCPSR